ncbi:MAG: DJ-1/PfpI family protein [Methylobacillus sp.]|jgi:4-methyl-5(b-hydroxyethyl)-thiazole monophosphate biosynthesis|nr:DJ-1/PfpI family protein [Methylobacillus sp.]
MAKVLIPLAQGCEELEAVTVADILRRADIAVIMAGLESGAIRASRGTVIMPDTTLDAVLADDFDMIVLPGGMPGSEHLRNDARVIVLLKNMADTGKYIAAICAAPMALHAAGLLQGKRATSFPGVLDRLPGTHIYVNEKVVTDGKIITSRGPGTALDFALTLVELLAGKQKRDAVEAELQR